MNMDPWSYLGSIDIPDAVNSQMYFFASLYKLLRTVGVLGCIITIAFALIKYASTNAKGRAELKEVITKKVIILMLIFAGAFIFGLVLGLLQTI